MQMRGEETRSTRQTTELEYASSFGSGSSGLLEGVLTNGFVIHRDESEVRRVTLAQRALWFIKRSHTKLISAAQVVNI